MLKQHDIYAVNSQITIFPFLLSRLLSNVLLYYFARPWQAEPLDDNVTGFSKIFLGKMDKVHIIIKKVIAVVYATLLPLEKGDTFLYIPKCH